MTRPLSAAAKRIVACGLIPIVRFERMEHAVGVVKALRDANVDIVEFPMTSPLALKAIEKIADSYGDSMVVGAGTVLKAATAQTCIHAGARFIVSPCVDGKVIAACRRLATTVCPGALTPTEVYIAWKAGADFIKVFPCGSVGGISYIESLKVPLPDIPLLAVGGVTAANVGGFMKAGCCAVGVGGGIVDKQALAAGQYERITLKALQYMKAIREVRKKDGLYEQ